MNSLDKRPFFEGQIKRPSEEIQTKEFDAAMQKAETERAT